MLMRMKNLATQSLWLDELHTMNEANPGITWREMFFMLKCCDQHPPLHFIIERIFFSLFGHTEFVARIISVLAGTISIWAMYFLGKEMVSKRLGLIAAALTCVNFYNLSYSQEARPYILAFLFAALSFAWFIRLVKTPKRKNALYYSLFTLLLLYSHYYSLFVVVSQGCLAILFIFQERRDQRKLLFRNFLFAGIIILAGYAPWISHLLAMTEIKSFWIQGIPPDFISQFFYGYFGDAEMLKPFLILLLLIYMLGIAFKSKSITGLKSNPLLFSFLILCFWVFITILIPYIRSLLWVPMLFPRYTIVILPAILIALAYGIELIGHSLARITILSLFLVLSMVHLVFTRKYYSGISKTQFREMTQYVVKENSHNFPIINELTAWHQRYYLERFGSKAKVLSGRKESLIDSILSKSSLAYHLDGFWIVGAHTDKKPDETASRKLDSTFRLVKEAEFMDAWARMYVSANASGSQNQVIRYNDFEGGSVMPATDYVAIWEGAIQSKPLTMTHGQYRIVIRAWGDQGGGQFPHINVYVNDKKIGDYFLNGQVEEKSFDFSSASDAAVIKIQMDNDFAEPGKGDRNAFVKGIFIEKYP
jgi:uncharacterized membrane protein